MRHFLVMTAFAVLAAVVFGTVAKDNKSQQHTSCIDST